MSQIAKALRAGVRANSQPIAAAMRRFFYILKHYCPTESNFPDSVSRTNSSATAQYINCASTFSYCLFVRLVSSDIVIFLYDTATVDIFSYIYGPTKATLVHCTALKMDVHADDP